MQLLIDGGRSCKSSKVKALLNPVQANPRKKEKIVVQVNLFQKHLFLHKLTHNMKKDCSWNYYENYKHRTWTEHGQKFCLCSALVVFIVIPEIYI